MIPQYRQPFDILIDMNKKKMEMKDKKRVKKDDFEQNRPIEDIIKTLFLSPSYELIMIYKGVKELIGNLA